MKPRVWHVITRLIAGGAQENTILSCQALKDRYDVRLLTGPPDGREGSLLDEAERRGIPTQVVPELVRPVSPARDALALKALFDAFVRGQPHLVHTHSSKAGILGRAAARLAGVPVVVHTNHGLPFYPEQPWPVRTAYWGLEKLAASVTDRVVCVGEAMKRQSVAAGLGSPSFFEVIHSGIEIERFLQAKGVRGSLGIPEGVPVVGMIARMARHKGHRFLAEAAPRGVHLLFVGDGEEREPLEKAVRSRGLEATFTGHVSPGSVPDLIASMDVLAHPSLWEGLPRAAVEALLAGRPVAAFDRDGASEVVVDGVTGRLVPAGSVEGLRAALEDLLSRPDRGRGLGEEGRRRCRERFDWRGTGEKVDRLYRALLERSGLRVI
jgi:glycosyltransferase involved in cell wall biosynthesis